MAVCTYGAVTDKGDRRPENQDSILCLTDREIKSGLFLVADGMGGLSRGGQVSRYIAERFARWWREDFPDIIRSGQIRREDMREFLEQQSTEVTEYDELLVRRLIEKVTVYGERFEVEFKSGTKVDVER